MKTDMFGNRKPSPKFVRAMASESFLWTIEEASILFRMDEKLFRKNYVLSGKIKLIKREHDGKLMIRNAEIMKFQDNNEYIYEGDS